MQEIVETAGVMEAGDLGRYAGAVFDSLDVSESTRRDYTKRVGPFLRSVGKKGLHLNSFLDFKRELAARTDIGTSTKNGLLVSARVLLRELHRQGYIPRDLTLGVKLFKIGRQHKVIGVSDDEMDRIGEYVRSLPAHRETARLRAILSLASLQGLRQQEIVSLDVADVDLVQGIARVRGKGSDDLEVVFLHPKTVGALRTHIRACKRGGGPLFAGFSNNSHRLTTRAVHRIITGAFQAVDVDKNPHGLRHWFVTRLLAAYEGDLLAVAHRTRHATVETVRIYDDGVKQRADLPRFYAALDSVNFG